MAVPYHTHTFSLPTATTEQINDGSSDSVVVTPSGLKPALDTKAPLASPTFTGTPAVPTADPGTDTTQAASTAFVKAAIDAIPAGGTGTVTSVGLAAPADLTVTNSPVTSTGTLTLTRAAGFEAYTTTEQAKLSGIEALADVTDAGNVGSTIHGVTGKTTPVDADELGLIDSAASNVLKKLTWANLKTTVRSYLLAIASQWTAPQRASVTSITSATTMTIDLAANNDFECTSYAHNGTLANPTNQSSQINQKGTITFTQDGTGGRTLSFASNWKFMGLAAAPSINTTAGVTTSIDYHVLSATVIRCSAKSVGAV